MEHDYKIELSKRRLEIAHERLTTAKAMLELGDYKASANRLYYARQPLKIQLLFLNCVLNSESEKNTEI